jgi:5,10-methylenetetrahydrofolate reductase
LGFLRVVEVFPPILPHSSGERVSIKQGVERFVSGVGSVREYCDLVLVADVKDPGILKFSSVQAAALLEREAGVRAAPVIVARDSNRPRLLSDILTAYGLGLRNLMIAWGDRYRASEPRNVYDFPDLASVISEARGIANRAGIKARILAPVNLDALGNLRGVSTARGRLKAGADLLLAQPPTTDSKSTLENHSRLLDATSLKGVVLPGVFPFTDSADVLRCEEKFGWRLPKGLHETARKGAPNLLAEAREVISALPLRGFPGVCVSTRGDPTYARRLLR